MKTITVEAPEGYKIDSFDQTTGKVTFAPIPKDVTERIKSFDDVLAELKINPVQFEKSCEGLSSDEIAYRQVALISQALNGDWTPDWGNSNEYKYYPWFNMGGSSGSGFSCDDFGDADSYSSVSSRLCFKSRELAIYAAKQFTEIYKKFYLI